MKGRHLESVWDMEAAVIVQLKAFTREDFQSSSDGGEKDGAKCVCEEGGHFEGISGNVSRIVIN